MARMYQTQEMRYPRTAAWIRQMRTTIPGRDNGRIFAAFREYAQLTEEQALAAFTWGQDPLIRFVRLAGGPGRPRGSTAGLFVPRSPTAVLVSYAYADAYEENPRLHRNEIALEFIVLHEMVHWGDWRHDQVMRPDQLDRRGRSLDAGDQFERAAYGTHSTELYLHLRQQEQERGRYSNTYDPMMDLDL